VRGERAGALSLAGRHVGDVDIARVEIGPGRKEKARDGPVGGCRHFILVGDQGRFKKLKDIVICHAI